MLLSFDTKNQIITRTDANRAIANSTDYFEVSVTFSANWNGYDKTICFKNGDTEINIMLVNNAVPKEAHLNLGVGTWKVSIIGIKGNHKILTNAVNLPVGASGYIGTTGPTPRVYEELLTIIQSLHTEVASEAALRSAVEQFVDENFHDIVISDVYSKSEIDSMIVTKTVNDLVYYWNKSQTYNRAEIEALIEAAIQGTYIVVQTLPTTDISTHAIYLVPKESATVGDYYNEYINTTGTSAGWEHIGTTEIDLSNYYTKAEINALLDNKVDKVSGKGLSTNDYDNTAKNIVDGVTSALANKVDKETGKGLSTNDYDNTAKGIVDGVTAALAGKVDKETGKGLSTNDYDNTEKAKLAGIAENATKTEASLTNGNIKINGSETVVYDDSELDSRVDTVEQDLSTDTATVTGNPLNFTTLTAQKANETVISLAPIQDLHGYDYPWPAGGGKNKLPITSTTETINGVTFTVNDDGTVLINGTATAGTQKNLLGSTSTPYKDLPADNYFISKGNNDYYQFFINAYSGSTYVRQLVIVVSDGSMSFTIDYSDYDGIIAGLFVLNGTTVNSIAYPMIRLATETDPTFAPYSNICPIDGRTEMSLVGCGLGEPEEDFNGTKNPTSGAKVDNSYRVSTTTWYKILANKKYYIKLEKTQNAGSADVEIAYTFWNNNQSTGNSRIYDSSFTGNSEMEVSYTSDTWMIVTTRYTDNSVIRPDEINIYISEVSTDLTIQFGEKVYGAKVELEKGTVTVEWGYIAEYNGETLPGEWISDRDVYAPNTSPSTGAEVAYELATPRIIHLTPQQVSLLQGVNNISTDGDSISLTYRGGKVATLGDLDGLVKKIADCEDVEITDLQASDVLVWDATAGKWKNQANTSAVHYDDTERVIGTWFGETLYQKTIVRNNIEMGNHDGVKTEIAHGISNFGNLVSLHMSCPYLGVATLDVLHSATDVTKMSAFRVNSTNIYCVEGEVYYGASAERYWYITLQYTKNTPTLLMQSTPTEESTPADESDSTDENR